MCEFGCPHCGTVLGSGDLFQGKCSFCDENIDYDEVVHSELDTSFAEEDGEC